VKTGLALIVVGVWIAAQILKGGALDRLVGASPSSPSTPAPAPSAGSTPGASYPSTGAGTNQPGYAPSAARENQYGT
jgi:hypothetical protein